MPAPHNNKYRNNYRTENRLHGSFDEYWDKNPVKSKNDSVKVAVRGVFNALDDILREKADQENYNRAVFDRAEFTDLLNAVAKILDKYGKIQKSDFEETNETVREKIRARIVEEFGKCLAEIVPDSGGKFELDEKQREKIRRIVSEFFQKNEKTPKKKRGKKKQRKKSESREALIEDTVKRFEKILGESREKTVAEKKREISARTANKTEQLKLKRVSGKLLGADISNNVKKILDKNLGSGESLVKANTKNLGKIGEKNLGNVERELSDAQKKVGKAFLDTGKKMNKVFEPIPLRTLMKAAKIIFSPITFLLLKSLRLIRHPVEVLTGLVTRSWFQNIAKAALVNPANQFMFGYFIGATVDFIKSFISPIVDKFITVPLLKAVNLVLSQVSPSGPVGKAISGFIDFVESPLKFLSDLFNPVEGSNNSVLTVLYNFYKLVYGFQMPMTIVSFLSNNGESIVRAILEMRRNRFMSGFASTNHYGFLINAMLFAAHYCGFQLSKIYNVDSKNKSLVLREAEEEQEKTIPEIQNQVREKMLEYQLKEHIDSEAYKKAVVQSQENIERVHKEMMSQRYLLSDLDESDFAEYMDQLTKDVLTSSHGIFNTENLKAVLGQISRQIYSVEFNNLNVGEQRAVVKRLAEIRLAYLTKLANMYNSENIERYDIAFRQLQKPYEIRYTGETQSAKEMTSVVEDFGANITLSTDSTTVGYNTDTEKDWKKLFESISENVSSKNQTDFYRFLKKEGMFEIISTGKTLPNGQVIMKNGVRDIPENRRKISQYARTINAKRTNTGRLHTAFTVASAEFTRWRSTNPEIQINDQFKSPDSEVHQKIDELVNSRKTDLEKILELKRLIDLQYAENQEIRTKMVNFVANMFHNNNFIFFPYGRGSVPGELAGVN